MTDDAENNLIKPESKPSCKFLISTLRLSLALLLVVVFIVIIVSLIGGGIYLYIQKKNKPLNQPKYWDVVKIESLDNAEFKLITKWKSGRVYFQFYMNGHPEAIKKHLEEKYEKEECEKSPLLLFDLSPGFTINFVDEYGFEIADEKIAYKYLSRNIDGSNQFRGFSYQGNRDMSASLYREIANWSIKWNL